jgi:hypothetical protein
MDDLPRGLHPVVQVIDDWFTAHKLALLFEAKVGKGKLIYCGMNLHDPPNTDPVKQQMLASIYKYANSSAFNPGSELNTSDIAALQN